MSTPTTDTFIKLKLLNNELIFKNIYLLKSSKKYPPSRYYKSTKKESLKKNVDHYELNFIKYVYNFFILILAYTIHNM